jgi:phosphoglucosamine mutase
LGKLFGTDGIRHHAGEGPLTPENVTRVGIAFGTYLTRGAKPAVDIPGSPRRPLVLLGHDGRRSADYLLAAIEAGLGASGVDFQELGLITTPGLATLVRELGASGGVMISASHNPARDNGVKLFGAGGEKTPDDAEAAMEAWVLDKLPDADPSVSFGQRRPGTVARPELYLGGLVERAALSHDALAGLSLAFDGANGGGAFLGPELFRSLGAHVVELATEPNGDNINEGSGAMHPEALAKAVLAHGCALGVALDGDGDRSIFADEAGAIVDGDGVLAACAPDLHARGKLPGATVVVSVMSNFGLRSFLAGRGVKVETVPVGDRPLVQRLRQGGFALGAEPSGHIVFGADNAYVGDGLYAALRVLELVRRVRKPLSALAHFPRSQQVLINVPVKRRDPLDDVAPVRQAREEAERALGSAGRVVLRYSGTEPVARVMVEASAKEAAELHATAIVKAVRESLG